MKTVSPSTKQHLIVFGLDDTGKPKAGRFPQAQAETARSAAVSLKLAVWQVPADQEPFASKIPVGRIHARGKAFIPYIKRELFDQLAQFTPIAPKESKIMTTSTSTPGELSLSVAMSAQASALPKDWDQIAPGHLVLMQESLDAGWFETIVMSRTGETLTLRLRDYPKYPTFVRHYKAVALLHAGLN